jgi:hypothetical protein
MGCAVTGSTYLSRYLSILSNGLDPEQTTLLGQHSRAGAWEQESRCRWDRRRRVIFWQEELENGSLGDRTFDDALALNAKKPKLSGIQVSAESY